jgi:cyclase
MTSAPRTAAATSSSTSRTIASPTADLVFVNGHPAVWAGPLTRWIAALDRILELDVDVVVPGHGPLTDLAGVRLFHEYLEFLDSEARRLHAEGRTALEAALALDLSRWEHMEDPERVVTSIDTVFRKIEQDDTPVDRMAMWEAMAKLRKAQAKASA